MHHRAQLEAAALGDQVDAVGEHHHDRLALEIDPERGAGEAQVSDRALGEVLCPTTRRRASAYPSRAPSRSPAAGAAASRKLRSSSRGSSSLRPCQTSRIVCAKLITSSARREQARVARDAAHHGGVRVVHLAPHDAPAPRAVLGRRHAPAHRVGQAGTPSPVRTKKLSRMPSGPKMRSAAELVERPARHGFDDRAEHDEVEVAVDGGGAGLVDQARAQHALEHELARGGRPDQALARLAAPCSSSSSWKPRQGLRPEECVSRCRSVTALLVALGEVRQELRDRDRRSRARRRSRAAGSRWWWRSAW